MRTRTLHFILALLMTAALIACGSDTDGGTTVDSDSPDAMSTDSGEPLPVCTGLGFDPNAAAFNDQCAGVTGCKEDMEPPDGQTSGCYCAVCGPKGNTIVCIQAQCLTPGQ